MPMTCQKCGNLFPYKIKVEGKTKMLSSRKFCLVCSPYGMHNTTKLDDLQVGVGLCLTCDRDFQYDRSKGHRRTKCNSCSVKESRHRLYEKALTYKGGQCQICGYDKCSDALDFHHRDPKSKDFGIQDGNYRNWNTLKPEIDKCDLLCCRCHREVHAGVHPNYSPIAQSG